MRRSLRRRRQTGDRGLAIAGCHPGSAGRCASMTSRFGNGLGMAVWQYFRRTTLQLVRGVELGKRRDKPGVHPTCTSQRGLAAAGGTPRSAAMRKPWTPRRGSGLVRPLIARQMKSGQGRGSNRRPSAFSHCVDVGVLDPQLAMPGCSAIVALCLTLLFLSSRHERT